MGSYEVFSLGAICQSPFQQILSALLRRSYQASPHASAQPIDHHLTERSSWSVAFHRFSFWEKCQGPSWGISKSLLLMVFTGTTMVYRKRFRVSRSERNSPGQRTTCNRMNYAELTIMRLDLQALSRHNVERDTGGKTKKGHTISTMPTLLEFLT